MYERCENKLVYILEHVLWLVISMVLYRIIVFRKLEMTSYRTSILVLCVLLAFFSLTGGIYDLYFRTREMGIFCNLCLGYGVYTCMAYYFAYPKFILVICAGAAVVTGLCLVALFFKKSERIWDAHVFLKRKAHMAVFACSRNFAVAMFMIMIPISLRLTFADNIASASFEVADAYGEEYNFSNNAEMISKIRQEVWETLSFQEKVDVAQAIAYCEGNYLGIPQKMVVVATDMEEHILGGYEDYSYRIMIDAEHLQHSKAEDVLNTILHEAYHCYQERCVEIYEKLEPEERNLMLFYRTAYYADEFGNYIDGNKDIEGYRNQAVEIDARAYAEENVKEYYRLIEEAVQAGKVQ